MKGTCVTTRLDLDLLRALDAEQARRGTPRRAMLVRDLISEALARSDPTTEHILTTLIELLERQKALYGLIGAAIHLGVEQAVLDTPQKVNELPEAYKKRLQQLYRDAVFDALGKGARIAVATANQPSQTKKSHAR